jgi:hypothetical protein
MLTVTPNLILGAQFMHINLGSNTSTGRTVAFREFGNNFFDRQRRLALSVLAFASKP